MPVDDSHAPVPAAGSEPVPLRGVERSLEVQLGPLGGFDLRPTRLFLWDGRDRQGRERIVALGSPPKSLDLERREHELRTGAVRVRTLGNPLMTVALAGVHAARAAISEARKGSSDPEGANAAEDAGSGRPARPRG
jgi:hypothetical protein